MPSQHLRASTESMHAGQENQSHTVSIPVEMEAQWRAQ